MENFGIYAFSEKVIPRRLVTWDSAALPKSQRKSRVRRGFSKLVWIFAHPERRELALIFHDGLLVNFHADRMGLESVYFEHGHMHAGYGSEDDFYMGPDKVPSVQKLEHFNCCRSSTTNLATAPMYVDGMPKEAVGALIRGFLDISTSYHDFRVSFFSHAKNAIRVSWWNAEMVNGRIAPKQGWWTESPQWKPVLEYLVKANRPTPKRISKSIVWNPFHYTTELE